MTQFERKVESIAKAYFEQPCPPDEAEWCNPNLHDWDQGHPEDKEYHRETVRFVLREAAKHNM